MDNSNSDDSFRIFVFRPYIPIFLKPRDVSTYENLLSELSIQSGTEIQSLHHMNGMEVSRSEQLKEDKPFIAVERNNLELSNSRTDLKKSTTTTTSEITIRTESSTQNSQRKTENNNLYIYIHSLYTYENSLLPFGCALMYHDLKSMDTVLLALSKSRIIPGSYITNLYDIHKNEIRSPGQLKNKHHYIAMPHIMSNEGYNFFRNFTPESFQKYKKPSNNFSFAKTKQSNAFQTLTKSTTTCNSDTNNLLQKNSHEISSGQSDFDSKNNLLFDNQMIHRESVMVDEACSSKKCDPESLDKNQKSLDTINSANNSISNNSDKKQEHDIISYYTIHCKNNGRHVAVGHLCPCRHFYFSNKDESVIYPCNETKPSRDDCQCCMEANDNLEKDNGNNGNPTFSMDEIKPSLTTIAKIAQVLKNSREVSEHMSLKKTSHYTSINIEESQSNEKYYKEIAEKLLRSLLLELEQKQSSSEKKGTPNEQTLEPLLLTFCELVANIFQTISKSLHEKINC